MRSLADWALEIVNERGRALAADIAEATQCAPQTASAVLRALHEGGHVKRELAPRTGRRGHPGYVYVAITA